ncbi:MAG: hypothetical protein LBK00_04570 [Treponema sp.]|jgi:hypothetical protein|nr:hypothetical protein [Treponema sp.]
MFGGNIKIHFAGCEQLDCALICHEAGVRYFLYSVFPFIAARFGIDAFPLSATSLFAPRVLEKIAKHTIMDSGLFTLMFGGHSIRKDTYALEQWQEAMIDFIIAHKLRSTLVEVDCQKICGADFAWELRKKITR